jgi:uncharacterized protein YbjQ (UPF0145 family)
MRDYNEQILSFGEIQEPHECVTIAYGSVRVEQNRMYEDVLPTDALKQVIIMLQEQAKDMGADGVKNINITVTPSKNKDGVDVLDYYAMGTLIKLKD